ncbi:MAG: YkgJ family cysteine cluster protein [Deltaproteobacteria bacterium]|nr:YkgJ family cysteine cluster protein [Deltaproteobacteria bacterium]
MNCRRCGTCCAGPDISTLAKPMGVPCRYLDDRGQCTIYAIRPDVCRGYRPDAICELIAAPTLDERVDNYLRLFGFRSE